MDAKQVQAEHSDFMKHVGLVLDAGVRLKKIMVARGLVAAKAKCPKCETAGALQGRLITDSSAGRHRRNGGAFRMWCENCADIRMME